MQNHSAVVEGGTIIKVTIAPEDDEAKAEALATELRRLYDRQPETVFHAIVDLRLASSSVVPAALQLYVPIINDPQLDKLAFFGVVDEVQRVFVEFAITFAKKTRVQIFDTEAEARAWLSQ